MTSLDYFNINTLNGYQFIGGTAQELTFDVFTSACAVVDLAGSTCSVIFSPYGNYDYAALTISGSYIEISASPVNRFTATISGESTQSLEGKYTMQPVIVDTASEEFRPAQGIALIIARNGG